jgi:hypothetical protein
MLSDQELTQIKNWSINSEELGNVIMNEEASIYREISEGILNLINEFQNQSILFPTGKTDFFGIDDLYTQIQLLFKGGEDLLKD